jgi:hypothetical protein
MAVLYHLERSLVIYRWHEVLTPSFSISVNTWFGSAESATARLRPTKIYCFSDKYAQFVQGRARLAAAAAAAAEMEAEAEAAAGRQLAQGTAGEGVDDGSEGLPKSPKPP